MADSVDRQLPTVVSSSPSTSNGRAGLSGTEADDPLLARLQDKFAAQRTYTLQQKRRQWDSQLTGRADKHNALNPTSVELLADETVLLLNELNGLCASHQLTHGVDLVQQVRTLANRQIRESLSYIEDGYRSAFNGLLREADFKSRQRDSTEVSKKDEATRSSSADHEPVLAGDALLRQCPTEWKANVREDVAREMLYQAQHTVKTVSGKKALSVRDTLSVTTSLFAESLTALLFCEVVRIYLYDQHRNLHCVARYPYHATVGDPMHVTFKEMVIAKELHSIVCDTKIAVNGFEPQYKMLGRRDVELIEQELKASGLDSLRSCLIFPIIAHTGDRAAYGMIHAVNKVSSGKEAARFDAADEALMSASARLFGCMLTRYPANYFTARVGEAFHRAVFPGEDTHQLDDHLPERLVDEVEDAAEVGNTALASREGLQIFRAPISDVYQTPLQRSKLRKLGNLALEDNTLSAVEFNLKSTRELWQSGFDDNVVMHRKYRELAEQSSATKLLLQNLLDGLAAARSFQDVRGIARYLQTLELLARSESTDALATFISETLMNSLGTAASDPKATETPSRQPLHSSSLDSLPQLAKPASPASVVDRPPQATTASLAVQAGNDTVFLDNDETRALLRRHELANRKVAVRIHVDGPECVRQYSTDPATKREQVRFIQELAQPGVVQQSTLTGSQFTIPKRQPRAGSAVRTTPVRSHPGGTGASAARPFHLSRPQQPK